MELQLVPPSKKARKCCVANCPYRYNKMHRFPKNEPEIFKAWIQRIKPPNFESLTVLQIYNKYYVCQEHFAQDCLVEGTRRGLRRDAIPSLNIPGFQENIMINIEVDVESPMLVRQEQGDDVASGIAEFAGSSTAGTEMYATIKTPPRIEQETENANLGSKKRRHFLHDVNVSRAVDLTPKAKRLYHTVSSWSSRMSRMQKSISSYRVRLANAEKLVNSPKFANLLKYVNNPTYEFIISQVRNQHLKPHARRYSLEQKILALSIAKSSGKAYRLLSKIFVLPAVRTLSNLLKKIPFEPGLNEHVFLSIQNSVMKMKCDQEKVCILMFDEMAIDTGVFYQQGKDCIVGFEDDGKERTAVLANHVNVFLLKGLYRQWKQPVAFTFSNGPIKTIKLKVMIKNIIAECQKIGLDVIATVCDQGSTNQSAIRGLLEETRQDYVGKNLENPFFGFVVGGCEVIPLFDVPHLMKGLRNNLLTKNLHFVMNGEEKIAKWSHIEQFYALDSSEPSLRLCSKLTDAHILKEKMNKMKVKNCTQVFSHTVGALMKRISQWDTRDNYNLTLEAGNTAEFILFVDKLFDSLNVSGKTKQDAKPLKWPINITSEHERFWRNALMVIKTMKFYSLKKNAFVSTPTLKNLTFTVQGFIYLKDVLLVKKNFKYILSRGFNQDPLENFFGYIRSHGYRNVNPDIPHFISSFKTLIANNFMSNHSPGANCEEDIATEGLDNLRSFLTGEIVQGMQPIEIISPLPDISLQGQTKIGRCTLVYISGYISKLMRKTTKNCENCLKNISFQDAPHVDHDFILARQYNRAHLTQSGTYLHFLVSHSLCSLFYLIPRLGIKQNISQVLATILKKKFNFTPINCPEHNLGDNLCMAIIRCALFWWCKNVNKIVKGKDSKFSSFLAKKPNAINIDPIKLHAHKLYTSRRKFFGKK